MRNFRERIGVWPTLILGMALFGLGLFAALFMMDNMWPFDVQRLDLVRATAQGNADATTLMEAANLEIIYAFLATVLVAVTGLTLPLVFFLNQRFGQTAVPPFLLTLRQAMWIGLWVAFCLWLQMNRTFTLPIAILVGGVLFLFEFLLQIRTRALLVRNG